MWQLLLVRLLSVNQPECLQWQVLSLMILTLYLYYLGIFFRRRCLLWWCVWMGESLSKQEFVWFWGPKKLFAESRWKSRRRTEENLQEGTVGHFIHYIQILNREDRHSVSPLNRFICRVMQGTGFLCLSYVTLHNCLAIPIHNLQALTNEELRIQAMRCKYVATRPTSSRLCWLHTVSESQVFHLLTIR